MMKREPELLKAKQDIFRIDKVIRRDFEKKTSSCQMERIQ